MDMVRVISAVRIRMDFGMCLCEVNLGIIKIRVKITNSIMT